MAKIGAKRSVMVFTCCVMGCNKHAGRDKVSFYQIPAVMQHDEEKTAACSSKIKLRHDWVMKLNRKREQSNQEILAKLLRLQST